MKFRSFGPEKNRSLLFILRDPEKYAEVMKKLAAGG